LLKYKSTDSWKQRFFLINQSGLQCFACQTATEAETAEPVFRIHFDKIEAIHVYLGGRFDVVAATAGALPLLVEGGGSAAHVWADAIHAVGGVFTLEETTRLRAMFRPSLVVEEIEEGRRRVGLERALLGSMVQRIGPFCF